MCMEVEEGGGPDSTLLLANARAPCAFQGGLLEVTGRHGHNSQVSQQQKTDRKHGREKEGEKEKRRKNIQYVQLISFILNTSRRSSSRYSPT
jgi:hypothetical protein